jgi:hypothetical protein
MKGLRIASLKTGVNALMSLPILQGVGSALPTQQGNDMADEQQRPKFRYQDMPELSETFADSIGGWSFDGSTLRLEFLVSRLDAMKPGDPATGRAVPVCRLVLTAAGAVELIKACGQVTAALTQAGVLRQSEAPPVKPS